MSFFARLGEDLRDIIKKADLVLLGLCLAATVFGIVLIASATEYTVKLIRCVPVQAAATVIGLVGYFAATVTDVEHLSEKWKWFFVFNLGFIALLLTPLGVEQYGNKSWLYARWMPTSIQPAEIVKLTYTILLARQLAWFRENKRMKGLDSLFWPAVHAGFMFVYIFAISKDAGSGLVYLVIYMGMALAAGLAWYWFALGIGGVTIGIGALAIMGKLPSHWANRFAVILDHSYDPSGVGWQQTRSMLAIGSGGLFGQGLFKGIQTHSAISGSLPERQTDFIFSVCGEELGLVGCLAIIALEFFIVYRCFQTARVAKSTMEALICVGFGTMLIFQTVENIGMCLFVMPVIGLTLPFFSYGGSSIVTLYTAMGVVSGVRSRTLPDWLRKT
ncbi:MAG: FtsW/RodA/SpoVE family cell cycle protein [Oscillospiraceae bacterium]|nr:FtsW/RodA/SpoVE family cell cycle protein [Oscillospiraceae bacterium]MCI8878926.1 FtsW/RodA/SpoVE family cell cycle protein [Oscillospiraceae bacterium]